MISLRFYRAIVTGRLQPSEIAMKETGMLNRVKYLKAEPESMISWNS
jgi:hypothetical protein